MSARMQKITRKAVKIRKNPHQNLKPTKNHYKTLKKLSKKPLNSNNKKKSKKIYKHPHKYPFKT
jgi:hypothetical protein